jgi:hypothetical protein
MEVLHLPDNIKIHFAGSEVLPYYIANEALGARYALFTAFPFVEKAVFGKTCHPIFPLKGMKNPAIDIPAYICRNSKHVIQDSGLFTLMFGASNKGHKDEHMVNQWYDGLVEYTLAHKQKVTCVEVDCQKILGVEKAWEFRQRMRDDIPNRIINVFHYEDGKDGLDRLIEFSDYIAISVPELRVLGKAKETTLIARYIKSKKPTIDIHLLGCTALELLRQNTFCTSADSTSYVSANKYGFIKGRHVSNIKTMQIKDMVGELAYNRVREYRNESYSNALILNIELLKKEYQKAAGNQDYGKIYGKE